MLRTLPEMVMRASETRGMLPRQRVETVIHAVVSYERRNFIAKRQICGTTKQFRRS